MQHYMLCFTRDPLSPVLPWTTHAGLFALSELCKLMGIDVTAALQLVQQVPGLLDVPSRTIEDNVRVSETAQGHTGRLNTSTVLFHRHTEPQTRPPGSVMWYAKACRLQNHHYYQSLTFPAAPQGNTDCNTICHAISHSCLLL